MVKTYDITQKSERNDYQTPEFIYKPILGFEKIRYFDIDLCCDEENIPAKKHYKKYIGCSLKRPWFVSGDEINFFNPPFNIAYKFIKKAVKEVKEKSICGGIYSILPLRPETVYFRDYIFNNPDCFWVSLTKNKNLGFIHPETKQFMGQFATPLCLVYFGKDAKEKAIQWAYENPIPGVVHFKFGG